MGPIGTVFLVLLLGPAATLAAPPPALPSAYVPAGFPSPRVPADNPFTRAKAELGRHLFYERRLSRNGEASCASCHRQEWAFTDGRARAVGATGELHPRSAMSLANVAYAPTLGWDDPEARRLEEQAKIPMRNRHPVELGLAGRIGRALSRLRADPLYQRLFKAAFPEKRRRFTLKSVVQALATFERTLISGNAPFDRWRAGEPDALGPAARRGMRLFFSSRLGCFECHRGFNFSGPVTYQGQPRPPRPVFLNTGLYDLDGRGAYPPSNPGLHRFTGRAEDMGRFRVPTLRNVAVTAPYMHDGSVASLAEVVDLYARGGRTASPLKSARLRGFTLSETEKADLLAFLESLTDREFLEDPRLSDPFSP